MSRRVTSEKVKGILSKFDDWMIVNEDRTDGGREEQIKHARIILNDIEEYRWDFNQYPYLKKQKGKDDKSQYSDLTMKALKGTGKVLGRFFQDNEDLLSSIHSE